MSTCTSTATSSSIVDVDEVIESQQRFWNENGYSSTNGDSGPQADEETESPAQNDIIMVTPIDALERQPLMDQGSMRLVSFYGVLSLSCCTWA